MRGAVALPGVDWEFLSAAGRAWLAALPAADLEGEEVKATAKRRVLRGAGAYAKEVRYHGLPALLKSLVGGTACREGRLGLELARRGVPVPEVLGFGGERRGGLLRRDLLLTREVSGGVRLHDFVRDDFPGLSFGAKCRLIEAFAVFIRQLHERGVEHADLHIGNILHLPGSGTFYLLDVDRVRLHPAALPAARRQRNLALLLTNLQSLSSRSQRFRFLRAYGIALDRAGRQMVAALRETSRRESLRVWRDKAHRCLASNGRFVVERRGGFAVHRLRTAEAEALLTALLPDPDRVLEGGELCKAGRTVRAARVELGGCSYFLKRYNCKGWGYRLRNALRRSRAVRTWLATWGFRVRDLPVPQPLLCLEERRWRLLGRSYLLSEFVAGTIPLRQVWPRLGPGERGGMLARLAILFGRMHGSGCLHGDLKWNNILVRSASLRELILTDLDGSRLAGGHRSRHRRKDIDRFLRDLGSRNETARERKFFLAVWARWVG